MKLFPESAYFQLEFDKIKSLLAAYCETDHARDRADIPHVTFEQFAA